MAIVEYWIQLENRAWDVAPNNIDRMRGLQIKDREPGMNPTTVTLTSPGSGVSRTVEMYRPLKNPNGSVADALILRRYKPPAKPDKSDAWTIPDDRKVNPWDLNEPDPTDNGTMGTIPGPVIECKVGDMVIVHFRNLDNRTHTVTKTVPVLVPSPFPGGTPIILNVQIQVQEPLPVETRTHSLHPHGFVFQPQHDGAYPLSPPDTSDDPLNPGKKLNQIDPSQAAAWASVGVTGQFKQGDRVPHGGTFNYLWNTHSWPSTAGVWLYHDHSICDHHNVNAGAIGIIVIHNPNDPEDVIPRELAHDLPPTSPIADLPGNSPIGSPVETICFPFPGQIVINTLPHDLEGAGALQTKPLTLHGHNDMMTATATDTAARPTKKKTLNHQDENEIEIGPPALERVVKRGDLLLELDPKFRIFRRICFRRYRTPPGNAQYLQLYHTLGDALHCINGRLYLGNTPTMVAGPNTLMRFGVVGMGDWIHTFHIHGHRWVVLGPDGDSANAIQSSIQKKAISQFEDTRIFGPANSFSFTVKQNNGSFMGTFPGTAVGEWHMHCHVLSHMMMGMMGSLLVVNGGEIFTPLPKGVPCPEDMPDHEGPAGSTIVVNHVMFTPHDLSVPSGSQVRFDFQEAQHTVVFDTPTNANKPSNINNGGGDTDAVPVGQKRIITVTGNPGGQIPYYCGIHGKGMNGVIHII